MRKQFLLFCGIALSSVVASAPASAQALNFTLSGARNATFTLNSSTPNSVNLTAFGDQIFFTNVAGIFGGNAETASSISFGTGLSSRFEIVGTSLGFTQFGVVGGGTLFTGSPSNPTFNIGSFNLGGGFSPTGTLTISRAAVAAVPEPGTWMMMLLGFGAIGVAARRRRTTLMLRRV